MSECLLYNLAVAGPQQPQVGAAHVHVYEGLLPSSTEEAGLGEDGHARALAGWAESPSTGVSHWCTRAAQLRGLRRSCLLLCSSHAKSAIWSMCSRNTSTELFHGGS